MSCITPEPHHVIWAASHKKVPNGLSRRHTKRRTGVRDWAGPSFGMTLTFFYFLFFFFFCIRFVGVISAANKG